MPTWNRLLSLTCWLEADPGPLQPLGQAAYLALAALFALGLLRNLTAWRGASAASLRLLGLLACMSGLGIVALRLAVVSGGSARIWVVAALGLAVAAAALERWILPEWPLLHKGWCALWAFRPAAYEPSTAATGGLLTFHLVGAVAPQCRPCWPPCSSSPALRPCTPSTRGASCATPSSTTSSPERPRPVVCMDTYGETC